jgi:hypothetical protein
MQYELDHIFICCSVGALEADLLTRAGLTEGSRNHHPGQGTACRRFFFANAYLELLWISDVEEASSETSEPTRLLERWRGRHSTTSPFGIALRPAGSAPGRPPFESWAYMPPYLPPGLSFDFAAAAPIEEPEMVYLRFGKRPDAREGAAREPIEHALGVRELTSFAVHSPFPGPPSAAARALVNLGLVTFHAAPRTWIELGFDRERESRAIDLRPQLPLVIRR